mgnify:CR=1 FL=1
MVDLMGTERKIKKNELEQKINYQNFKLMVDQIGVLTSAVVGGFGLYAGADHKNFKYAVVSASLVGICGFAIRWYKHSKELDKLYNESCNL